MSPTDLGVVFFFQAFIIVGVSRAAAWVLKRLLDQPQVVGEMIAGVVLGPSMFGLLAPQLQQWVFPSESKPVLYVIAQLGVGLYMFLVGLDFEADHLKSNSKSALAVSLSGIVGPFLAAIAVTPWLLSLGLFERGTDVIEATLFTGAAIATTAFPVLARIIEERGLSKTALGALTLSAGAVNDAGAWAILAVVLARISGDFMLAAKAIVGGCIFLLLTVALAPKLLAPIGRFVERKGAVSNVVLCLIIVLFLLSAWAMDSAGLHSAFGGFIFGTAVPRGLLTREIKRQIEPLASALLIPVFFTYSGLNTQMRVVNSIDLIAVAAAILAVSVLAKGIACWGAARLTGQDAATSMGIGALMNARGLMELIIINLGLAKGIIGPALFSILALMAIVTTLMASPLFELVYGRRARASAKFGDLNSEVKHEAALAGARRGASTTAVDPTP
ncbi:cation:proton antiporter [Bradyrhizobium manausense]|uniref:Potassium transporter n=1 Tax=Bradyrhizobium manausense TaxID=989370 RepID=A0A0R3D577_9BRAD|nr:cation:proton antiporter [Bradyrhizobium manausense]KRQ04944.1 potassium transporter [Bradyrhizobium manausense]